jgi:hypothetical protein
MDWRIIISVMIGFRIPRRRPSGRLYLVLGSSLLVLFFGAAPAGQRVSRPPSVPAGDLLDRILEKTELYCRRLEKATLDFICREKIEEKLYSPPLRLFANYASRGNRRVMATGLEYDYQLIRKGASLEEKRVLLKENNKKRNEPGAVLKTKLYKHQCLVFGPVGLLGESWQPKHTYAYLGEEKVNGEKTFLIEATPTGPSEPGLVYGKAWIRQKDFAIVKIEWDQRSLGDYYKAEQTAQAIGADAVPEISIVGHFGIEKKGIRFLDRVVIREDYRSPRGSFRVSEATVRYVDYRFFVVETEVRY